MFSLVKQGLVNLLIEDHKILGIFHLQQILESDVKQIPKPWDIYQKLSIKSHQNQLSPMRITVHHHFIIHQH